MVLYLAAAVIGVAAMVYLVIHRPRREQRSQRHVYPRRHVHGAAGRVRLRQAATSASTR